jgi:hypothetical protein
MLSIPQKDIGNGAYCLWAPRIISNLQGRCVHEKAAKGAEEQVNLVSTNDEIA